MFHKIFANWKRSAKCALSFTLAAATCSTLAPVDTSTISNKVKAATTFDITSTYGRYSEPFTLDTDCDGEMENVWSTFTLGSYPQSQVTDEDTLATLENISEKKWVELDNPLTEALNEEKNLYYTATINGNKYLRMKIGDANFGSTEENTGYYQWDTDSEYHYYAYEPITWRILSLEDDGTAFVIADTNLDTQPYSASTEDISVNGKNIHPYQWKYSILRDFLNGYEDAANGFGFDYSTEYNFMDMAFSSAEKESILLTEDVDNTSSYYNYFTSSSTNDYVYLLSYAELTNETYGFTNALSLRAKTTDYAYQKEAYTAYGYNYWWLRSAGDAKSRIMNIDAQGNVHKGGHNVTDVDIAVRPVMKVDLSTLSADNYAGYVDENQSHYIAKATFILNNDKESIALANEAGYINLPYEYEQDGYDYSYYYNGKRLRSFPVISTKDITIHAVRTIHANTITVYYKASSSWSNAYIHYKTGNGNWTKSPGVKMEATTEEEGYNYKYVIDCGDETSATVCFNNGNNTWDSQNGSNYKLKALGEYGIVHHNTSIKTISLTPTATPVITETPTDTPVITEVPTATPIVTEAPTETPVLTEVPSETPVITEIPTTKEIAIYYNTGWKTPYIHYQVGNGAWTKTPGVKMTATSEQKGYTYKYILKVDLTVETMTVCFNNGDGSWDSKNGANYTFRLKNGNAFGVSKGSIATLSTAPSATPVITETPTTTPYITQTPVVTATPTENPIEKTVTIFYSTGWSTPYIHYCKGNTAWTKVPGVKMEATSEIHGYNFKYVIPVEDATTSVTICFNNGNNSWDSKNGSNYTCDLKTGTAFGVKNGIVTKLTM